jgi:hypothetical protein
MKKFKRKEEDEVKGELCVSIGVHYTPRAASASASASAAAAGICIRAAPHYPNSLLAPQKFQSTYEVELLSHTDPYLLLIQQRLYGNSWKVNELANQFYPNSIALGNV